MLRIRFSRTGKVGQPSYRIVVAEHSAPVKGRYLEIVGNYMPGRNPKVVVVKKERVDHWIKMGAIPTDSVASLLKKENMPNMEKYMEPRNKMHKKKGEEEKAAEAKKTAPAPTSAKPAATPAPSAASESAAPAATPAA